jgi:hypothetical protein
VNVWSEPKECQLCGAKGFPVKVGLVEWADALPGMKWSHVARCENRVACRERFEATAKKGEKWPVREGKAA